MSCPKPQKCAYVSNLPPPMSGYLGGKFRLAKKLLPLFPAHNRYIEPFAGAGWLLFRKSPSPFELINDINGELVNCYRQLRDNYEELERLFHFSISSREEFIYQRDLPLDEIRALSPVKRAWRWLYLLKCSFGGAMGSEGLASGADFFEGAKAPETGGRHPRYGACSNEAKSMAKLRGKAIFAITKPTRMGIIPTLGGFANPRSPAFDKSGRSYLERVAARLCFVVAECLDFDECILRHDRPDSFFYLDPPYINNCGDYGDCFGSDDYGYLAALLRGVKGKFLLTGSDCQIMRDLFHDYEIMELDDVQYNINKDAVCYRREIAIANYDMRAEANVLVSATKFHSATLPLRHKASNQRVKDV